MDIETQKCKTCNKPIPQERIDHFKEIGKEINTCVKHSETKPVRGYQTYPHKTGSVCIVINGDDEESIRRAENAHRRTR